MNFKKPGIWLGAAAIVILITGGLVLLSNGQYKGSITPADEKEKALKIVQKYFDAFAKADYKTMSTLATESHNQKLIHAGDVWGMKWAKAKEIEFIGNAPFLKIENSESTLVFGVSVDMETVKTSAQYPSTQTFFYVLLVKGDDGIWRVDGYTTG